jgi:hypothetical protein
MGEFSKWLMHEDRKEVFEFLFAGALSLVFVAVAALALWPLGDAWLALRFAKGGLVFWLVLFLTAVLLARVQKKLDWDLYSHSDAYVISGVVISAFLQAGWSAFAALAVRDVTSAAQHASPSTALLYFVGLLSCLVALQVVNAFYTGHIYRFANLAVAVLSFALFGVWPAAARAAYGWFFRIFGA